MLYARFIMPILTVVRAEPITREYSPPCSLVIDPNTCSTLARILDMRLFLALSRSVRSYSQIWCIETDTISSC